MWYRVGSFVRLHLTTTRTLTSLDTINYTNGQKTDNKLVLKVLICDVSESLFKWSALYSAVGIE
jgi:hypothetical protein